MTVLHKRKRSEEKRKKERKKNLFIQASQGMDSKATHEVIP